MSSETVGTATGAAALPEPKRIRRSLLIALAVLGLIAGVVSSWAYNSGLPSRHDDDAVILHTAVAPSTYVEPGDYYRVTVPVHNDGPFAVTVVGLYLPTAPRIHWDGAKTVIQSGATALLKVNSPFNCPAVPHALKNNGAVPVLLRVLTVNGNSHASVRTFVVGMLQYSADYCAIPTKKKD